MPVAGIMNKTGCAACAIYVCMYVYVCSTYQLSVFLLGWGYRGGRGNFINPHVKNHFYNISLRLFNLQHGP